MKSQEPEILHLSNYVNKPAPTSHQYAVARKVYDVNGNVIKDNYGERVKSAERRLLEDNVSVPRPIDGKALATGAKFMAAAFVFGTLLGFVTAMAFQAGCPS